MIFILLIIFLLTPIKVFALSSLDIQQQINNLPSSGGTVYIPAGEHLLTTSNGFAEYFEDGTPIQTAILINKDNVVLEGDGPTTILKLAAHTKMRVISVTSKNVVVKNMTIDGNKAERDGSVPWPNGDVVDGLVYGAQTSEYITFENLEIRNGIEDAMGFWKSKNVIANNNWNHDNGTSQAGGAGLSLSGVIGAIAENNRIENNTATGIWSSFNASDVKIINNIIRNNMSGGITLGGGTAFHGLGNNNSEFEVKNNTLSGNGSAGFATITIFASKNGVLDHNKIESSQFDNIQIDGTVDIPSSNWKITYTKCASTPGIRNVGHSQDIVLMGNSCQTNIPQLLSGDININGRVDIFDYNILVSKFGNPYTIFDYNILVANFGKSL